MNPERLLHETIGLVGITICQLNYMCLRARDQIIGCFFVCWGLIKIMDYRQEI